MFQKDEPPQQIVFASAKETTFNRAYFKNSSNRYFFQNTAVGCIYLRIGANTSGKRL